MFKTRKKLKIIILCTVTLIIIAMAVTPVIIKNYIINNSKELAGRQIDIKNLKYNYFTSTAKVYDFKLFEANEKDVFVSFDTLIVNLEPLKYFKGNISIEQFYVRGLSSKVVMKDSTFNFDDLIAFHSSPDSIPASPETEEAALKYAISNIEFKDSNFYFDNKTVGKLTEIEDLNLAVPFIGWNQEEKSNADVQFNFKNGGYFKSKLNINPVSGDYDALIELNNLLLDPFLPYVEEYAEISAFKGILNCKIDIIGNTNEAIKSIVKGSANVTDFEMIDTNAKTFLSAKKLTTELQSIDYYNSTYELASLTIDDSYTYFQLDSLSNNFFRIFKLEDDSSESNDGVAQVTPDSTQSETASSVNYAINKLSLNKGVLDYTDNLTGQPFNYHLSEIEIDSDSITNQSKWLDIYATMLLNERGTLKSELGINPNNYLNTTLDIAVENFLLPDLNIYVNHYMGHSILAGDMYYFSKSKIVEGQIASENKLLVKNASLENTRGGLYDLPLKFAFFLLTDKNGDVNLDIPVSGDINDPSTDVGSIVWQTFKNVIGKTVAAPVNFLVGLVGGDPKELEEMTFAYNDSILSPKHKRQLSKLIDLETQKDSLKITMTYYVDETLMKEAMASEIVGQEFNKTTGDDYLKADKDFKDYVLKKVANDSLDFTTAINQLTKDQPLDSLAKLRGQVLMTKADVYIKQEYPISKITLIEAKPEAPENSGAYPKFLITYGLLEGEDTISDTTKDNNTTEISTNQ